MGTCPIKKIEKKRLFKRLIKQTDWKNNLTAIIVDSLGWPDQQNGWMTSSCSAFHSTHFKRFAAWKTVDIASTFIIINMGAEQRILRMKVKQSLATSRRTRHGHCSSSQDRVIDSCGLNHVSWSSPQLAVSQWVLSQRNYLFIKRRRKENRLLTKL